MARALGDHITWPEAPCCAPDYPGGCQCPAAERALRAWKTGAAIPAMTAEQRDFCLQEIDRIEGYRRADHEAETDAELANTVLCAWTDFCRDKGLL